MDLLDDESLYAQAYDHDRHAQRLRVIHENPTKRAGDLWGFALGAGLFDARGELGRAPRDRARRPLALQACDSLGFAYLSFGVDSAAWLKVAKAVALQGVTPLERVKVLICSA